MNVSSLLSEHVGLSVYNPILILQFVLTIHVNVLPCNDDNIGSKMLIAY